MISMICFSKSMKYYYNFKKLPKTGHLNLKDVLDNQKNQIEIYNIVYMIHEQNSI